VIPWMGVIAMLGVETTDHRVVHDVVRTDIRHNLVISERERKPVGHISDLHVHNNIVYGVGWLIPDYIVDAMLPCGVDLDNVIEAEHLDGVLHISFGSIRALTLYDAGSKPAWPECHIQVGSYL